MVGFCALVALFEKCLRNSRDKSVCSRENSGYVFSKEKFDIGHKITWTTLISNSVSRHKGVYQVSVFVLGKIMP